MKNLRVWRGAGARRLVLWAAVATLLAASSIVRDNRLAAQDVAFAACKQTVPGLTNRGITAAQAVGYLNAMAAAVGDKGPRSQPILKPTDVAIGDFNGDGCDDIAEIDRGATPAHLEVLVGVGDGTFSFFRDSTLTSAPISIATTDVDLDGLYDIAIGETGAQNGIEVFTGAFLAGVGTGPMFTQTPIVPEKLGGLSAETGRVLNWSAIFDEVHDFETTLVAAGPNAGGQTSLLSFPAVRQAGATSSPLPMRSTPLQREPTVLTIGPVGSFAAGQVPALGTFIGGPNGLDVYLFDNPAGQPPAAGTGVAVATPTSFHINDTPNPRKVAIGLDTLPDGRKSPFTATLGFGVLVVNNADQVNVQSFVVNAHANAFDLSVFGFDPQPIGAAADGGGGGATLAVAVAPTPEHPTGSVSTFVLPHVLEKSGTIINAQFTFDTTLFVNYTPGLANPPLAFGNFNGSSATPGIIASAPNGFVGGTIGTNGLAAFPVRIRTDIWTATQQYFNRDAFFRLAGSTPIPGSALSERQWATGFGLSVPQANLISSTAPALNKSLLELGHLQLANEQFPWIISEHITVTTVSDAILQPGGPLVAEVNTAFTTLANDVTRSTNDVPALGDEASLTNYVGLIDDLDSLEQRCETSDFFANPTVDRSPTRQPLGQQGNRSPQIASYESLSVALDAAHAKIRSSPSPFARAILSRGDGTIAATTTNGAAFPTQVNVPADSLVAILRRTEIKLEQDPSAVSRLAGNDAAMRIALGAALGHPVDPGDAGLTTAHQEFDAVFGPPPIMINANGWTLPSAFGPVTLQRQTMGAELSFSDGTVIRLPGLTPVTPGTASPLNFTAGGPLDFSGLLIGHPDGNVSFRAQNGTWTISPDPNQPAVYTGFNGLQWAVGNNGPMGLGSTGMPLTPITKVEDQQIFGSNSLLSSTFAHVGGGFHLLPADAVIKSPEVSQFLGAEMVFQKRYSQQWSFGANLVLNDWLDHLSPSPVTSTVNTNTNGAAPNAANSGFDPTLGGTLFNDAGASNSSPTVDFGAHAVFQDIGTQNFGSSPTYYDFGAIEEVQVTTGGNDALQLTGGIGINIVTKRGSNDFHGSGGGIFNSGTVTVQNSTFSGNQVGGTSPRVNQILDFSGEVGGPVIKDRLWFWGSGNRNQMGPPTGGNLIGQITDGNQANMFFHFGDKTREGGTGNAPMVTSLTTGGDGGFDLGGGALAGTPSSCCTPGVQILTLDFGDPATVNPTTQTRDDEATLHFSLPWMARGLVAMLRALARGSSPFATATAMRLANQPIGMPPAFAMDRGIAGAQTTTQTSPVRTVLTATGNSQGEAFDMKIVNEGRTPLKVFGSGVVVEPIKRELQAQVQQQVAKLAGNNVLTRRVEAYCLQYALAPPSPGMLYQIAGPALQKQFKPAGLIMSAARRLAGAGAMHPDSNPKSYLDSIKQYAIWTKFENWDRKKFGEVLLDKTKKAAAAAKANWTGQMESMLMSAVPNRWRDIQTVLSAAQQLASKAPQ